MSIKKLLALRDQIATLVDQRADIGAAAITRQEAAARFDHQITRVQTDHIHGMGPGGLASNGGTERDFAGWLGRPGFLAEVFGAEIKEALLRRFDAEVGDGEPGLPVAERRAKLKKLDGQIYELERAEEELIEALEADGADIARRPDASPHAALGLAPPREAA